LEAEYELTPIFNLAVPTEVKRVPTELLHPENSVSKVLTLFSKSVKMQLDVDLH
jgi:ATP-dependent phosphoenolpyruvate carboxykinase